MIGMQFYLSKVDISSSHRLQPKFVKKEGDGGHPSIQVADMVQVARFSPRLLYFLC
jgi:hypothetical protein